jgi:hypothetical protein
MNHDPLWFRLLVSPLVMGVLYACAIVGPTIGRLIDWVDQKRGR